MKKQNETPKAPVKSFKKTLVLDGFSGEEREVDPRRIRIIDGFETEKNLVRLDNGKVLTQISDGKYQTQQNPRERWGEVVQVRADKEGAVLDAEFIGWTQLSGFPAKKPAQKKPAPKQATVKPPASQPTAAKKLPVRTKKDKNKA